MSRARDVANSTTALNVDGTIKLDGNYPVGTSNVALGDTALDSNVSGNYNTAIGADALTANTASNNTAVGYQAGYANTTGTELTFFGYKAGANTTGSYNTYVGSQTGITNTSGTGNTGVGWGAISSTSGATDNTAVGYGAGSSMTTGSKNTIIGRYNGNQGGLDIRTASNYIVLSDGDGNPRLRINNSGYLNCPGVYADSAADSANVVVDGSGNIYRSTSALKYKQDIRDIEEIDINQFRPVRYKSNLERDDQTKDHFGFIADEAHDAGYTELVSYGTPDEETGVAEVEGFRYDRMTVLLTKVIQQQQATIDALEARMAVLEGGAA